MKFLLSLFLLASVSLNAQLLVEKTWSSGFDSFPGDVAYDEDGNAYFAVAAYSANVDSSLSIVVKTDPDYNILWSKRYRAFLRDDLACVTVLEDGNIVVGGTMRQSFAPDEGGGLIKIDPDGNVIWHKLYSNAFDDRIIGVFELDNGNLVSIIRWGVFNQPSRVLTTDADGVPINEYSIFSGTAGLSLNEVIYDGEVFYGVGGIFNSQLSRNEMFLVAFNAEEVLWFKRYDSGRSMIGSTLTKGENGLVFSGTIVDPGSVLNGTNIAVLRTDNDGEILWAKEFFRELSGFNESGGGFGFIEGDALRFTQFQITENGFLPVIAYLNQDGSLAYANAIELEGGSSLIDLGELEDGRSLHVGTTGGGDLFLATAAPDATSACMNFEPQLDVTDLTIEVTDEELITEVESTVAVEPTLVVSDWVWEENTICSAVLSTGNESSTSGFQTYPNPVEDELTVVLPSHGGKLLITDITGQRILEKRLKQGETKLVLEYLKSGVYLVHVTDGISSSVRRIVKR